MFTGIMSNLEILIYIDKRLQSCTGESQMEVVDVSKYTSFKKGSVFREVPILTNQTMATILLVDSDSKTTDLNHPQKDRIYYVVKGSGEVTIENEARMITEGELILIPKGKSHKYTTNSHRLTLISINQIDDVTAKKKVKMTQSKKVALT
jgi:mannose-6-phosphate isomerase-like protein (cupin superfamily)